MIAQVGPTSLRDEDAVTVEVKVLNAVWQLRVSCAWVNEQDRNC